MSDQGTFVCAPLKVMSLHGGDKKFFTEFDLFPFEFIL